MGFTWDDSEQGRFREDFFPPVVMPVIEHKPWVLRNMPIPPGIYDQVCKIIKTKIDTGVYERSNSSYQLRWFTVLKKGGISLRIVHSLEPLNAVTIQHSGVPPFTDQLAEHFAGRACGGILDLYVGYDKRTNEPSTKDRAITQHSRHPSERFAWSLYPWVGRIQYQYFTMTSPIFYKARYLTPPYPTSTMCLSEVLRRVIYRPTVYTR
jgi:hypothetical protein